MRYTLLLVFSGMLLSGQNINQDPLSQALASDAFQIQKVTNNPEDYEVQIILSTIHRKDGQITFQDYNYRLNDSTYFYPASTVKFPAAVLALERIHKLEGVSRLTPYKIKGDSTEYMIQRDVEQIFAVSDNAAFNRLFEILSRDSINGRLQNIGIKNAHIVHRLSIPDSDNAISKEVTFLRDNGNNLVLPERVNDSITALRLPSIQKGKGYMLGDSLVSTPLDFSRKNQLPLNSLHDIMKRVVFPEAFSEEQQFKLSEDDYAFLRKSMSNPPRLMDYSEETYPDNYVKYFLFGDIEGRIPRQIKIYNKVGMAYGTLTDTAYIHDLNTGVEYILSATIYVNSNGILNDDTYDYESIGIPFLSQLSREIHEYLSTHK